MTVTHRAIASANPKAASRLRASAKHKTVATINTRNDKTAAIINDAP